jgi:hypothetical protein
VGVLTWDSAFWYPWLLVAASMICFKRCSCGAAACAKMFFTSGETVWNLADTCPFRPPPDTGAHGVFAPRASDSSTPAAPPAAAPPPRRAKGARCEMNARPGGGG